MTVEKILKIFEEGYKGEEKEFNVFTSETKLFTNDSNAFACEEVEQPCVALVEMTIPKKRIKNCDLVQQEKVKIVAMINGYDELQDYHCVTIGEFLNYLKHIEDKQQYVCIVDYFDLSDGEVHIVTGVVDAKKSYCKNRKLRKNFGDDALQFQY